jgi:hypothetical protein
MHVKIKLKPDTLDALSGEFSMTPLRRGVFLNSVPKSGSHLVRNIVRMFVSPSQRYSMDFIQHATLRSHLPAFAGEPMLSWGHLFFSDEAAVALRDVNHIVLVRDPYDWVLARTRFFLSEQFQGNLNAIKNGAASVEEVMNLMIFGALDKAPPLADIFQFNAVAWIGTKAHILRYEDVLTQLRDLSAPSAEGFFRAFIVDKIGLSIWPADWRQRVEIGADRTQSATAREHLNASISVPEDLPLAQKRLVDYHAPGLRALLGYA